MDVRDVVWLFVLFDLPATTAAQRKVHTRFRLRLLGLGFQRLQWSVYARAYPTERASGPNREAILKMVPARGRVRLLIVTDLQFGRMICTDGPAHVQPERALGQVIVVD